MDIRELQHPPALPGLYARAALPRKAREIESLDPFGVRATLPIDPGHLARYRALCGFADNGQLPVTYPDVLALPLQLSVMLDQRFPFRVLGIVHLSNGYRCERPLADDAPLTLQVCTGAIESHDRGLVIEMITTAHQHGAPVWHSHRRLLARFARPRSDKPKPTPTPSTGAEIARWTLPESLGRRYARVSGDFNPIHLHPWLSRPLGFSHHIAHGMWTLARALATVDRDNGHALQCEGTFKFPVYLPTAVKLVHGATPGHYELRAAADDKLHLQLVVQPPGA